MQYIYVTLPLLIMATIILISRKVNFRQVINAIFFGLLSAVLVMSISSIFHIGTSLGGVTFLGTLMVAAIPEELAKFICITAANSKTKTTIFINSILVAISFAVLENVLYMYSKGYSIGLSRTLAPGHFIFEIAMALLLIQSLNSKGLKKAIFTILALIVPMLLHASFNAFDIDSTIMMVIGGISYLFSIIYIMTLPSQKENIKKFPLKVIGCILVLVITLVLIFSSTGTYSMNKDVYVEDNDITINVMSVEKIKDGFGSLIKDNYKVKIKITNNDKSKDFSIFYTNFSISDDMGNKENLSYVSDENDKVLEKDIVEAGETRVLYFYFDVDSHKYNYFIYNPHQIDSSVYTFIIK